MSTRSTQISEANRMHKRRTGLVLLLGVALILCCAPLAYVLRPTSDAPVNSVRRLAETYGVSEQKVLQLANELDVNSDRFNTYGLGDFPYNYFHYRLEQIEIQNGVPTKDDVEAIVQGYEVKCELFPENLVYLFYSDRLTSSVFTRPAMMLDFRFKNDLTLDNVNQPNLADSGHEWKKQTITEKCLNQ